MKVWIHINGIQEGPYELGQLPLNRINPDTPVWYEGLDYWKEASQAPEVARLLAQAREAQSVIEAEVPDMREAGKTASPEAADVSKKAEISEMPERPEEPVSSEPVVSEPVVSEPVASEEAIADSADIAPKKTDSGDNTGFTDNGSTEYMPQEQMPYSGQPQYGQPQPYGPQPQYGPQQPYGPQQQYYQQPYGSQQGAFNPAEAEAMKAPTHLLWAILATLLCCAPLGIVAIITSVITGRRNDNYDFAGARRMSEATEWWIILSIVLSLITMPFMSLIWL